MMLSEMNMSVKNTSQHYTTAAYNTVSWQWDIISNLKTVIGQAKEIIKNKHNQQTTFTSTLNLHAQIRPSETDERDRTPAKRPIGEYSPVDKCEKNERAGEPPSERVNET